MLRKIKNNFSLKRLKLIIILALPLFFLSTSGLTKGVRAANVCAPSSFNPNCVSTAWLPDTLSETCNTQTVTQTSNCGYTREVPGAKICSAACVDIDRDGFDNCATANIGDDGKPKDCDDNKNFIYPGAIEACDTFDNNCDGSTDEGCDKDGDGYCDNSIKIYNNTSMCPKTLFTGDEMFGNDCDDNNASIYPDHGCHTYCGDHSTQNSPENDDGIAETCDDGNIVTGDGCDANCQLE